MLRRGERVSVNTGIRDLIRPLAAVVRPPATAGNVSSPGSRLAALSAILLWFNKVDEEEDEDNEEEVEKEYEA